MKPINLLLFLSLIACLCSCQSQKKLQEAWLKKGIRKGYIDTTTQVKTDTILIDTGSINAIVDTVYKEIFSTIVQPCDEKGNLRPETKKKIVEQTKKKLAPAVNAAFIAPFRNVNLKGGGQLSLWYDTARAEIDYKLTLPGQRLICPEPSFKEACAKVWWLIPVCFFGGIFCFLLFLYLVTRLKR